MIAATIRFTLKSPSFLIRFQSSLILDISTVLSVFYKWGSQRRQVRIDYQDDVLGGNIAVRLKNGGYRIERFGGYVSIRDLEKRDQWKTVALKANWIDALPDKDFEPIPSGHILGAFFGGQAYIVLSTDEELVIPVPGCGS